MDNNIKYYNICTFGCQMNEEDSEKLSGMLASLGYCKTENRQQCDVIIFNTCCIRENAELKFYGNLGALKKLKKENPNLIIAVCGCMMQQEGVPEDLINKYPYVDIIFGTHNAHRFPEYLNRVLQDNKSVIEILNKEEGIIEGVPIDRESSIKAFVTIMYGCNNFCTYCIVPYVRGRERSRTPENIEKEVIELVSKGYKEITLLGQNVNSYGKDLDETINFADLLRRINNISGLERIRFMTSHPKDLTMEVILAVKECEKVCEHIHLPVQSGSSKILKNMNRHYDRDTYLDLVKKIKKEIPDIAISTDIIIGFPGEEEEDILDTLSLVKEVEFDSAFTFIYSKRKGTPADSMEDSLGMEVKHERFDRLVQVVNEGCIKRNLEYEGKVCQVLVEGFSKNDSTKLMGRTRTGKLVNFSGSSELIGQLVMVKIIKANSFSLVGEKE